MANKRQRIKRPVGRTVMWRRVDEPGSEIVEVTGTPGEGWRCRGHVQALEDGAPVRIDYLVLCDEEWATTYVDIEVAGGPGERRFVQFLIDPDLPEERWQRREAVSREAAPALEFTSLSGIDDLIDVDLEFSPLTNTLPIRRLSPRTGDAVEVTAAWVRFPSLTIDRLVQRYERLSARRVRYTTSDGFEAELEIDELGLLVRYGGLWERVAAIDAPWSDARS